MSNITGANKTPLGKYNPGFPSFQSSSSLLKPNYLGGASHEDETLALEPPPPQGIKREKEFENNSSDSNSQSSKCESREDRRKKRKSRWGVNENERVIIPGMPTMLPSNLSADQERIYLVQLQIEEASRRLRTGDLGIPLNPEERSPSPEPIYNNEGKRLNTREFRTRKRLEDDRHSLIQQMIQINPAYKPPADYKAPQQKISEKVLIPQEEYPDINFVGLLIGPRGNTLKSMEKDTQAKIIIRGKGSVKEGKIGRKDGQPMPGEDEPLHAFITGNTQDSVTKAVARIKEVIRQGIEVPENQNDLRRNQLRELALLNGTLRESDGPRCSNCGSSAHRSWQCPDKPNITNNVVCSSCGGAGHISKDCKEKKPLGGAPSSKIDEEYMSLMAELGQGPPPKNNTNSSYSPINAGVGFSGLSTQAQSAPKALMAPSVSFTQAQALLPTPNPNYGQQSNTWGRDSQAYWTQASAAYATGTTDTFESTSYSNAYPQNPSWYQGTWNSSTGSSAGPSQGSQQNQSNNQWGAYIGGVAPPPPPPPPASAMSSIIAPPPPPPPPSM